MRSPILMLSDPIAGAAFAIAPEKASSLLELNKKYPFSLRFVDETMFGIRINIETGKVTLPIAAMEYLWCCAHAFFVFSQECDFANKQGEEILKLSDNARVNTAIDLLNWSMTNMEILGTAQWPESAPKPIFNSRTTSDSDVATEIFLCAVAWIIQHEISHVVHGDLLARGLFSVQEEKAADIRATQWILVEGIDSKVRQKRILSFTTAILSLQLLDRPGHVHNYIATHPRSVERLDYCLDEANAYNDEPIVWYSVAILKYHLDQCGINVVLNGNSAREILRDFMVAFVRG